MFSKTAFNENKGGTKPPLFNVAIQIELNRLAAR